MAPIKTRIGTTAGGQPRLDYCRNSSNGTSGIFSQKKFMSLDEARTWIGQSLVLQRPLLGFRPGLLCTVMCVVDFGDELLLWITTDDSSCTEVDQMTLADIEAYFKPAANNSMQFPQKKNQDFTFGKTA